MRAIFNPRSIILGLLVLGLLAVSAVAQPAATSSDQAVAIVTETQLGGSLEGIRLYVYPRLLPAGETVSTWKSDVYVTPDRGWFVFVDRYPGANWEHPCWYFFVDAESGDVQRYDAKVPPRLQGDLTEITDGRDNPPPGVSERMLEDYSARLRELPKPAKARGQAWAFIISGGANAGNNHIRYWNDSAFIYRTLVEYYGYADDHIRVCIADGTDPAADRSNGTNSPPDLDGDGDDDIEYPATMQYIGQVFNELAISLTAADQLFIFTTDHGGQESGQDCYLNLWNWEELRDDQLAAYVDGLPCQTVICTFEQCYSGGMIDDLQGDGRVIATAADWDELSWAMPPDYIYDTFVYFWTSAVAFADPYGTPVDADSNDDGIVSMHEAFIYAEANDISDETPQYSSTPAELGDALNLFGNLEGVYLVVEQLNVDDDNVGMSRGDGDGVIDFGETIELSVSLHNMGLSDAIDVDAVLATGSSYVTLVVDESTYGAIPAGGTAANSPSFVFSVASDVPHGEPLELTLNVTETPGQLPLEAHATAPDYAVLVTAINDSAGDSDGVADPGETVGLTLEIANTGGCDSPDLDAVLQSGGYFVSDPTPCSVGVVPVGGDVDVSGFSVQISPDCPEIHVGLLPLDLTGPASYHVQREVLLTVGPWYDTAEMDMGWALGVAGDTATSGMWERVDPLGTIYNSQQVQPEDDHTTDPGHMCFVTANGTVGGTAGEADVDGGTTTLLTPVFNVEGASSVTLTYWRWYTNDLGNNPGQDYWTVEVTADGSTWAQLEYTAGSNNIWLERSFDVGSFVPLTGTVQFRFIADDQSPGSLVEAAVDDIMVSIIRPPTSVAEHLITDLSVLAPCRPNPIGSGATLQFRLGAQTPVTIELYDLAGRRVRTLYAGAADAGEHRLDFRTVDQAGRRIAAGIYFVRMVTPTATQVRQVTVIH